MTNTGTTALTATETAGLAALKLANAAASDVCFYAKDMLRAQACKLTGEARALKVAQADAMRMLFGTTDPVAVSVPVYYVWNQAERIGSIQFML